MKEFIFSTAGGYRKFIVLGKNLKNAEKNFKNTDIMQRNGFNLKDLPVRFEKREEK